ncbi:helix-turn-helix domain-containing protein [Konateibacter massiliensis]|uniref:helix-turn-helix domain-containing protein n=1 Tax=Konateibacter massiliensis TaxID=2002841 RepID=UPI000C14B21B|nr:helix-turn-helix transcriptional regulator [Konateibacter massiliensis]
MNYDVRESGKRMKELRKSKGYTQESFAQEIGISHRTYSGIEIGRHSTSIETFVEMAKALDTTLDYLIAGKMAEPTEEIGALLTGLPKEKRELALRMMKSIAETI